MKHSEFHDVFDEFFNQEIFIFIIRYYGYYMCNYKTSRYASPGFNGVIDNS